MSYNKTLEEGFEKQLRLNLYNFKACTPDYNEINVQEILELVSDFTEKIREGVVEEVEEIHTELHNGRMETAYKMTCDLLTQLKNPTPAIKGEISN